MAASRTSAKAPKSSKQKQREAEERAARSEARERFRLAKRLDPHAPKGWRDKYDVDDLVAHVRYSEPLYMFVLGLDIRRSTFLMKEAVEFGQFAMILDAFISAIRARIRNYYGGWFDKFTGDGFLAFWIIEDAPHEIYHNRFVETMGSVLEMGHKARLLFDDIVLEEMRHNSRNMPAGLGVSVGVDAGPGYLVEMADSLTVVGPPVVGAVRMLEASVKPGEILLNVFPGSAFLAGKESTYKDVHFGVDVEFRATKEYKDEGGQEVYVLTAMPHAEDVNEGSP